MLGLGAWVTRASAAGRCDGRLPAFAVLGQEQAQALWTSVIATETADEQGRPLALRPAQSEALARLMAEAEDLVFAWDLGAAWRAPVPLTFEQQLARAWHKGFRERCRALGVGSRTMLLEACVARGVALASPHAGARGFAAAGPMLRGLLPSPVADTERGKVTADYRVHASVDDECDAALDWARAARAEGEDGGIALVCVDTRSVDAVLARARRWQLAAGQAVGAPADLNAPLARLPTAPLVEHALLLLQSLLRVQPMDAAALVTSPFIAGARTEFGPRARLAARLRSRAALRQKRGKQGWFHSVNLWAMGKRRPMPNALVVTFRPGAACWRLYSLRSTLSAMSRTRLSGILSEAAMRAGGSMSST